MTIKILGRDIRVSIVPATDLARISEDMNCLGLYKDGTIYLSAGLSEEDRKRVLIHELVHAVLAISGLTNLIEDKLEEAICDAMETLDAYVHL